MQQLKCEISDHPHSHLEDETGMRSACGLPDEDGSCHLHIVNREDRKQGGKCSSPGGQRKQVTIGIKREKFLLQGGSSGRRPEVPATGSSGPKPEVLVHTAAKRTKT